jgi:biotin synthase
MRPQNKAMIRYRMDADTIQAIAQEIVHTGIGIVFLQAGEHPTADAIIAEAVPRIHKLGADVLLNVGERPRKVFADYARLGVGSYILKFETSDPQLYQRTVGSPLDRRLDCVGWIREVGMRLGTGNIVGLPGQTLDTLADDILLALRLGPDFVSASPFVPNENTPYEGNESGSVDLTLNSIALCRLLFPTALIPAVSALEKLRKDGQRLGLEAGANVLTINFTPKHFRDNYAIYSQGRFVVGLDHVRHTVARAGLAVQTLQ